MSINKEVIGFYPNWTGPDFYLSLNYDSLSTIAWFSLKLQSDGSLYKQAYPPANLISYSHSLGKKVVLCMNADYGSTAIDTILANPNLQTIVINNLLNEVQTYGFDGVDIDLEGIPTTNRVNEQSNRTLFTNFIVQLSNTFWNTNRNYRLSIDLPPYPEDSFDTATLQKYVNYMMIMGYDYHWSGSSTAGAVAPIDGVSSSINRYLQTIPSNKLILGVPYYGYEWNTQSDLPDSPVIGTGTSIRYADIVSTKITVYPRQWNTTWQSPYYAYQSGGQWHQGWYDDEQSLGLKYDLVNSNDLAGIGIWALGFDTPRTELSNLIINKFSGGLFTKTNIIIAASGLTFIMLLMSMMGSSSEEED